jgi:hypothetical protein
MCGAHGACTLYLRHIPCLDQINVVIRLVALNCGGQVQQRDWELHASKVQCATAPILCAPSSHAAGFHKAQLTR